MFSSPVSSYPSRFPDIPLNEDTPVIREPKEDGVMVTQEQKAKLEKEINLLNGIYGKWLINPSEVIQKMEEKWNQIVNGGYLKKYLSSYENILIEFENLIKSFHVN